MKKVDINVDVGEGFLYDEALLELATSATICCGEHAGSWDLTLQTIEACTRREVRIGCHPGYPDRASFGRTPLPLDETVINEWVESVLAQTRNFVAACPPSYLKPHGAFYNDAARAVAVAKGGGSIKAQAQRDPTFWARVALATACRIASAPLMGLPGTAHEAALQPKRRPESAGEASEFFIREGFADRRYDEKGLLVPRIEPGALLDDHDEISEQVLKLAHTVDSICVHGDREGCVEIAELVRKTLVDAGYEVGF